MITTAVQQPSQIAQTVEIQGAPVAASPSGDIFRATLAASVDDAAAQAQSGGLLKTGGRPSGDSPLPSAGSAATSALAAILPAKVFAGFSKNGAQSSIRAGGPGTLNTGVQVPSPSSSSALSIAAEGVLNAEAAPTLEVAPLPLPVQGQGSDSIKVAFDAGGSLQAIADGKLTLSAAIAKAGGRTKDERVAGPQGQKAGDGSAKKSIISVSSTLLAQSAPGEGVRAIAVSGVPGTWNVASLGEVAPALVQANSVLMTGLLQAVLVSHQSAGAVQAVDQEDGPAGRGTLSVSAGNASASSLNRSTGTAASSPATSAQGAKPYPISLFTAEVPVGANHEAASVGSSPPANALGIGELSYTTAAQPGARRLPGELIEASPDQRQPASALTSDLFQSTLKPSGASQAPGAAHGPVASAIPEAAKSPAAPGSTGELVTSDARGLDPLHPSTVFGPLSLFQASVAKADGRAHIVAAEPAQARGATQPIVASVPAHSDGPVPQSSDAGGGTATRSLSVSAPGAVRPAATAAEVPPETRVAVIQRASFGERTKPNSEGWEGSTAGAPLEKGPSSGLKTTAAEVSVADGLGGPTSNLTVPGPAGVNSTSLPPGVTRGTAAGPAVPFAHTSSPGQSPAATGPVLSGALSSEHLWTGAACAASAEQPGESHRTLLATPTALEVGVQSGTQGWLRIRAEVGSQGEVNASLAAGSNGARELLHSQIPALNAFLHNEHIVATTTVLNRTSFAGSGPTSLALGSSGLAGDSSGGFTGSNQQGGSALQEGTLVGNGSLGNGNSPNGDQRGGSESELLPPTLSTGGSEAARSYDARGGVSEAAGPVSLRTSASGESGRWLNVRV